MDELGVPAYDELVFVARKEDLDEDGASRIRRFLQATARGHRALEQDPAAGVDALLEASNGLDRGLQEAAVKATLPVVLPRRRGPAVRLAGPAGVGRLRALDAGRTGCSSGRRTRRGR